MIILFYLQIADIKLFYHVSGKEYKVKNAISKLITFLITPFSYHGIKSHIQIYEEPINIYIYYPGSFFYNTTRKKYMWQAVIITLCLQMVAKLYICFTLLLIFNLCGKFCLNNSYICVMQHVFVELVTSNLEETYASGNGIFIYCNIGLFP